MTFYELYDTGGVRICELLFDSRKGAESYALGELNREDYTIRMLG